MGTGDYIARPLFCSIFILHGNSANFTLKQKVFWPPLSMTHPDDNHTAELFQ